MDLESLQEGLGTVGERVVGAISNPIVAGVGGAIGGAVVGSMVTAAVIKRKRKKSYKNRRSKSRSRVSKHKSKYARTSGKRKDTSHRRIRMTKNGQPYVIMGNGRARFISKSSARRSRKLKGGRY